MYIDQMLKFLKLFLFPISEKVPQIQLKSTNHKLVLNPQHFFYNYSTVSSSLFFSSVCLLMHVFVYEIGQL